MRKCRFCNLNVDDKASHVRFMIEGEYSHFCNEDCRSEWCSMNGHIEMAVRRFKPEFIFQGGQDYGDENDSTAPPHRPPENNK